MQELTKTQNYILKQLVKVILTAIIPNIVQNAVVNYNNVAEKKAIFLGFSNDLLKY